MGFRSCLGISLLAFCCGLQAAGQPVPPKLAVCDNTDRSASAPCMTAEPPLLMVSIQPTPAQEATVPSPVVDEHPFVSLFERSPLMRMIAWYCGAMAPLALILLTGITIFEYAKRRKKGDD